MHVEKKKTLGYEQHVCLQMSPTSPGARNSWQTEPCLVGPETKRAFCYPNLMIPLFLIAIYVELIYHRRITELWLKNGAAPLRHI